MRLTVGRAPLNELFVRLCPFPLGSEHASGEVCLGQCDLLATSRHRCCLNASALDLLSGSHLPLAQICVEQSRGHRGLLFSAGFGFFCPSTHSFIHCSFSTEYSMPAMFQAGCEALKTLVSKSRNPP